MDERSLQTVLEMPDGQRLLVRPLRADDADALSRFFAGLTERTRSFYGPHPFDRETAERLCAQAADPRTVRFVALPEPWGPDREIIAYMILTRELGDDDPRRCAAHGHALDAQRTARFAPVVADAWQERGIGSRMARFVLGCAPALGLDRIILMGGVQERNIRARRMYERLGFRRIGYFDVERDGDILGNYDMMLDLL